MGIFCFSGFFFVFPVLHISPFSKKNGARNLPASLPSLKLTASLHLKMDGIGIRLFPFGAFRPIFRGKLLLVSGRDLPTSFRRFVVSSPKGTVRLGSVMDGGKLGSVAVTSTRRVAPVVVGPL